MALRGLLFGARKQRKRLFIHIGHCKAGTSALRLLLDRNRDNLAEDGLDYRSCGCFKSKHSRFAVSVQPASPQENCLISSEEIMRFGAYKAAGDHQKQPVEPWRPMQDAGTPAKPVGFAIECAPENRERQVSPARGNEQDIAAVSAQCREGLESHAAFPHNHINLEAFAGSLPTANGQEHSELLQLAGFPLVEMKHQRQQLQSANAELRTRLAKLEERVSTGK